jgi:glucose uptake protein
MILPQTYTWVLFLTILSLICLGSWANLYKLAGKWRYEFFYVDFAFGMMIAAAVAAFTVGSLGFDGFSVSDDLINAGKRQWVFAFLAGAVFNLGNVLLMGAVSVGGMATAFPISMGTTLTVALLIGRFTGGRPLPGGWLAGGLVAILAAMVCAALAHASVMGARRAGLLAANRKREARGTTALKGILLAFGSGLITAVMYPLLARASLPEIGLGPYSLTLLFALGMFLSTFVYSIFFMNLPVEGEPVIIGDYFRGKVTAHIFGLVAGIIWCAGALSNWLIGSAPRAESVGQAFAFGANQGTILLAGLWGLLVWRDFRQARGSGKAMGPVSLLLLALGLALLVVAVARAKA